MVVVLVVVVGRAGQRAVRGVDWARCLRTARRQPGRAGRGFIPLAGRSPLGTPWSAGRQRPGARGRSIFVISVVQNRWPTVAVKSVPRSRLSRATALWSDALRRSCARLGGGKPESGPIITARASASDSTSVSLPAWRAESHTTNRLADLHGASWKLARSDSQGTKPVERSNGV